MARLIAIILTFAFATSTLFGATSARKAKHKRPRVIAASFSVVRHTPLGHLAKLKKKRYAYSPWTTPTFADSTAGDMVDGEDLTVRRAAVQALGPYNGSVVVVDPQTGRLLTIVNQKLAFKSGFEPCSTIKLVAALAGLSEGVIDQSTVLKIRRRHSIDLTEALAKSNNVFFANVGERLGFERVSYYAKQFGLGERATLDIPEELPGTLPDAPPADGMGMMTSFGEGIYLTPLQLAAFTGAIANGGTLYYLQHPRSQDQAAQLVPRVKRQLDIDRLVPNMKPGMMGAVEYGTARRASFDPADPILGKTGTCTDLRSPTHLGWFASYNDIGPNKLVVVVLLTGGKPVNGPVASGVAGAVYRNLTEQNYFAQSRPISPLALISTQAQ
jgi:penicillin-binding protein 2